MSVPNVNCKIQYIENEETLSRSPALMRKYGDKRNFYSCKQSQDYMTYVATGATQKLDYIEYSGDKEKSTGIFGKDGLLNARQRKELREQLRETKSIIWDCLLTFQPEFGQTYCNDYEQAYAMMKREMPRFLKDAGFNPENVVWYAGLHTNKRHRHIHISFFEKEPSRYRQRGKDCDAYLKYSKLFTEAFGRDFYLTEAEQAESMAEVLRYKDYPDEKLLFSNKAEAYAYGKRALDNYAKYGAKDWYDWCVKNWGTKWNACDTQVNDYDKPEVYFNTAWGSIPELLCALSEQNPGCEFEYEYADEDVGFHTGFYLFKNGKVIEGGPYDDQSRGAYETYFALWGGETDFRFNAKTGTYEYIDGEESM